MAKNIEGITEKLEQGLTGVRQDIEKMLKRGMHPENFKFYLETFRNGMPPHGGFAIGLERILSGFLGIPNIKEVSLFPRDINKVAP